MSAEARAAQAQSPRLAGVLEAAERLLVLAREGCWEQFAGAYPAYAEEVRARAGATPDSVGPRAMLASLTRLARITKQFTDLAVVQRERHRVALSTLRSGRKAQRCYGL